MAARWDLLNALAQQLGARNYLEIGVQHGHCFNRVNVPCKLGVDPAGGPATHCVTSDHFFAHLVTRETRFDLIFVDGLHHREQVHRDILNAWAHLTPGGAILVHDCDPPSEQAGLRDVCGGIWCGDVWRGWLEARYDLAAQGAGLATVETDLGCGLVVAGSVLEPVAPPWPRQEAAGASWGFYQQHRREWLRAVSVDEFHEIVCRMPRLSHAS